MDFEPKIMIIMLLVIAVLGVFVIHGIMTGDEREATYRKELASHNDLDDCGFIHTGCPYYVLDKKLDRILEILEKEKSKDMS